LRYRSRSCQRSCIDKRPAVRPAPRLVAPSARVARRLAVQQSASSYSAHNRFSPFAYYVVSITQIYVDILYPYSILLAFISPPSRLKNDRGVSFCTFGSLGTAFSTVQKARRVPNNQANQAHQSCTLFPTIKPFKSSSTPKENTNQSKYRASKLIALLVENYVAAVLPSYTYTAKCAVTVHDRLQVAGSALAFRLVVFSAPNDLLH
jgi:hypothetical protein